MNTLQIIEVALSAALQQNAKNRKLSANNYSLTWTSIDAENLHYQLTEALDKVRKIKTALGA